MALIAFIIFVVVASLFVTLKWYRTSRMLYAISLILFLTVACGPIPIWLLDKLQSPYASKPTVKWGDRNAIVLLGAGTEKISHTGQVEPGMFSYSRFVEVINLYNDCQKAKADCKIIVSGGDADKNGVPEALLYRDELIQIGINPADVLSEPNSMNTWQNAQFTSSILKEYDASYVFLVSSGIHLQRSMLYLKHFGVSAIPIRADYLHAVLSQIPLSYNLAVGDLAIHEYIGIVRYYVYNQLNWNPARRQPGKA